MNFTAEQQWISGFRPALMKILLICFAAANIAAEAAESPSSPEKIAPLPGPSAPTNAGPFIPVPSLSNAVEAAAPALQNPQISTSLSSAESITLPPALLSSAAALANSNLLNDLHLEFKDAQEEALHYQFRTAQRQRQHKLYDLAINNLTALLEGEASEELKKAVLLELAVIAQEQGKFGRAIQIYAQYQRTYTDDAAQPEIYLRQGLLYRKMGAPALALSKFYAVMTSALTLKAGNVPYYQKLVLQAQTEIADTYFSQGKLEEAADFFRRLLKQDPPGLNKSEIQYKLVHCRAGLNQPTETVAEARLFLERFPGTSAEPEIRFLLANALKKVGQQNEALRQVMALLQSQENQAASNPTNWIYWQQRAGNQIANELYLEGDYINALQVYLALAGLNQTPAWQWPVWYQIGLVYEKLDQPQKAAEMYARIAEPQKELASELPPNLQTVLDMARWRAEFVNWQVQAQSERSRQTSAQVKAGSPLSSIP
jgi:tetratricopeptide (TPR) repeat protein